LLADPLAALTGLDVEADERDEWSRSVTELN